MRFGGRGGLGGGGHFYCKYCEKNGHKAPPNYFASFHLGLITSRFHYWKAREVIIFMVSGHGGRDHDSHNQWFLIWERPRYCKRKNDFLKKILGQMRFGGLGGLGGGIFIVNIVKRIARKLRKIILLYFGLITSRLNFITGKPEKPLFLWFLDMVGLTMTPKTNDFWLGDTKIL